MITFLILLLVVAVAWLVIVVCLQALTIREHERVRGLEARRAEEHAQELLQEQRYAEVQEQRYRLMWDVRRLQEQQIFALQQACNAMHAFIRSLPGQQQLPPGNIDSAVAWKPPGWKPGNEEG